MTRRAQNPGRYRSSFSNRALRVLRTATHWSQRELARAAGVTAGLISDYEHGRKPLSEQRLAMLLQTLGYSSPDIRKEARDFLAKLDAAREEPGVRPALEGPRGEDEESRPLAGYLGEKTGGFLQAVLGTVLTWDRAVRERDAARGLWDRLRRQRPAEMRALLDQREDLRSWALCELLCQRSVEAAGDRAVELAEVAVWLAERIAGEEAWRLRLQGFAWAHLGNARRVRGDLSSAAQAFQKARKLWAAGADPLDLLAGTRMLDLEALLRREQGRFREALKLLDQALKAEEVEEERRKHLLINKAAVLEALGSFGRAIEVLSEAAGLVAKTGELRLLLALRLNMAVNHEFLGHHAAAEAMLPKIRQLAAARGDELDLLRVRWLEGRIAAGRGRRREAVEALSRAREGFASREIAHDAALASLELAVLYLEDGRAGDVRLLARQMVWIFHAPGIHREALAALRLFCEAADKSAATAEMARRLARYLLQAQSNPHLRFEGFGPELRAAGSGAGGGAHLS